MHKNITSLRGACLLASGEQWTGPARRVYDSRFMYNAVILKRVDLTHELVLLHVKPDCGVGKFLPGQYVALGLLGSAPRPADYPAEREEPPADKIVKRAYSIGSSPTETDYIELYIAIIPDGTLTSRLAMLREGDRVFLAQKITGTFTVNDVPSNHNLVLISTGTGIAPYMSMIRTKETWSAERTITVIHGVRYSRDLAYREELETLQRSRGNLFYYPIVSRHDEQWHGARGHVQNFFKEGKIFLNSEKDHVFLCGNPAMIDDLEARLLADGFKLHSKRSPGNLHLEKYW